MTLKMQSEKNGTALPKVVMVGEPIRPSSDFYQTALDFRAAVEKLALTNSAVIRELVRCVVPVLEKLKGRSLDGCTVELVVTARVRHASGKVESIGGGDHGRK